MGLNILHNVIRSDYEEILAKAHTGNLESQYELAFSYWIQEKHSLAFKWWAKAARKGHPDSIYRVGGYLRSPDKRWEYYKLAADMGSEMAQHIVAMVYDYGGDDFALDVQKSGENSLYWWTKLAERGNYSALHNLAVIHECGSSDKSVAIDLDTARDYYAKAYSELWHRYQDLANAYVDLTGRPTRNLTKPN